MSIRKIICKKVTIMYVNFYRYFYTFIALYNFKEYIYQSATCYKESVLFTRCRVFLFCAHITKKISAPVTSSNVARPAPMYTYVIKSINFWGFVAISVTTVEVGEWLVGDVVKLARKFSHILDIGNCPDSVFVVLPR